MGHRDVKLENVVIDQSGSARLVDYGLAKIGKKYDMRCSTLAGNNHHMAPEIISAANGNKADTESSYEQECDWWSLGVLLYEMYTGKQLFYAENADEVISLVIGSKDKDLIENKLKDNIEDGKISEIIRKFLVR